MKKILFAVIGFVLFLMACSNKPAKKMQFVGAAQGTYYSITYYDEYSRNFQKDVDSILNAFDQSVSIYKSNSIVSKLNRNEAVELDQWFIGNFELSQRISSETSGSFDITIGPLANIWGFGTFEKPDSINYAAIDSVKKLVGYERVKIENGRFVKENPLIQLNFNAIAQGYAVDVLSDFFINNGIESFLIDLGGEIFAKGQKPDGAIWKIGIEIPEEGAETRFYNEIVSIKDEAVASSGNYRKFYEIDGVKYAHSLDPKTGFPVKHSLLSTTVIAPTTAEADAYATAFMVMGVDKTLEFVKSHPNLKVYMVYDENGEPASAMSSNMKPYLNDASE
jgi:thiamine biosynthesis lipoprotein